ncbi:MAG: Kelch repeat-containing protein, partial [Candidatus Sericytochromatia bacterium]
MKKLFLISLLILNITACSMSSLEVSSSSIINTPKVEIASLEKNENMFEGRTNQTSIFLNNKLYAIGGSQQNLWTPENWVYDTEKKTWEKKSPMLKPRSGHSLVASDSKIYSIGGFNGNADEWYESLESYDIEKDLWESKPPMGTRRTGLASAIVDNKIYVFGGTSSKDVWLNSVEAYDIKEGFWRDVQKSTTGRTLISAQTFKNRIYVFGGENENGVLNLVEEYNPSTDTWRKRAPMPNERSSSYSFESNGLIFVLGGYDKNRNTLNTVDVYNPQINKWVSYQDSISISQD